MIHISRPRLYVIQVDKLLATVILIDFEKGSFRSRCLDEIVNREFQYCGFILGERLREQVVPEESMWIQRTTDNAAQVISDKEQILSHEIGTSFSFLGVSGGEIVFGYTIKLSKVLTALENLPDGSETFERHIRGGKSEFLPPFSVFWVVVSCRRSFEAAIIRAFFFGG